MKKASPWDFTGNEWAVHMLMQHALKGSVRHAYLITGAPGVGRRTLALRFAQAINCPQPVSPGIPCGTCPSCLRIEKMQHPDLSIVQAETEGGNLKVEMIRELQHSLALSPFEARYRIGLMLRFEEANSNAQNAFLKTLEEPNPNVVLLLTASSAEELLPTIASRCEVIRLSPMPVNELCGRLEQTGIEAGKAKFLAHLSGGRPGLALRYHQQEDLLEERASILSTHKELIGSNRAVRFRYAEKATKQEKNHNRRAEVRSTLIQWLSFWRDVMLVTCGSDASLTNIDLEEDVRKAASLMNLASARDCTAAVERTISLIDKNVNLRLALEVLLLDLPRIA